MKDFFKGVRKHIGRLDAAQLREQYALVADELANSEMIFHAASDGIIVLDEEGRVTRSNPAASKLMGMDIAEAVPRMTIPLGKSSKREIEITYPEPRVLEQQTMPSPLGTIVYLRDITAEKRRSEEELRAGATQAVRELASGVAHEIGNPLNALSLNLQIMQRAEGKDPETIEICRRQVERLDGILKGFLQALRPSRPNLAPGNASEPLKNCLRTMKPQFEERRIVVTLDIPAALPPVAIDSAQMEQVFFNLLKNALEAIPDGGAINITVSSDDNDVQIVFRDSGIGMNPDQIATLFEPYRTTKEHGTGLGLMITQRIVRDHGGTIAVESAPGEGTTFTISLPRLERRIRALK